jgi:aspartate-semialdehyde dehydrogenase
MKLAVVGATGLVGTMMLKILEERKFPITELIPIASPKSVGKSISFQGKLITIKGIEEAIAMKPNIAIFSAGGSTSLLWAPRFAEANCVVIDNSSAWRMKEGYPLIVPEINASILGPEDKIIANPNCSTIQMVLALSSLQSTYGIKRIVVSTYQSVTGTGVKAVDQLENERHGKVVERVYPHQIDKNCLPHGGDFDESGYTTEEIKLLNETRKIFGDNSINVSATVVRVPVIGGHSEAINVELRNSFRLSEVKKLIEKTPGVEIQDDPDKNLYPMPLSAHNRDEVFVGRIRQDNSQPNTLDMWVVSDNLRKGAATNAIQIAEYLVEKKLV